MNSWWSELSTDRSLICVSDCVCVCVCGLMSFVSCLLFDPWGQILACHKRFCVLEFVCVCVCVSAHCTLQKAKQKKGTLWHFLIYYIPSTTAAADTVHSYTSSLCSLVICLLCLSPSSPAVSQTTSPGTQLCLQPGVKVHQVESGLPGVGWS